MPLIPSRNTTQNLTNQASSLLQVLTQLHPDGSALLVASHSGEILAASPQAEALFQLTVGDNIRQGLELETEGDFAALIAKLEQSKRQEGTLLAKGQRVACQLQSLQFQGHSFLCLEFSGNEGAPQEALAEVGHGYHNVFDETMEPLFILDQEGDFIDINQSALELINQEKADLLGKSIFKNFDLNLFERVALRNQLQSTLQGEPQRFEWWLRDKEQELTPIEVSLRRGTFDGKTVIFGSAKNLYEAVGAERNVRFRNHQLEFVNHLITNLSGSDSREDVLRSTLEELLDKSDVIGGAVYAYDAAAEKVHLAYSQGVMPANGLPADLVLPLDQATKLFHAEKRKVLPDIIRMLEKQLAQHLTVMPVTTDSGLIALLLVWPGHESKITQSFVALLDFIGTAIGNYIATHDLQQQLSSTEDKYKKVFESTYDAILLFRDGVVVECNEKALQFFRCKKEDLLGKAPKDYSPEYQPDGMLSTVKTAQLIEQIMSTGEPITFEWKNIRKDGTPFDAEITLNRILIDGHYHILAFKRDITQRKQMQHAKRREEVARESMAHFRDFLEKVNLIYYSLDTNGNIAYANDYFLKYVEYSREEVIGQNFYEMLVPDSDRETRFGEFKKSLETKQLNTYYERDVITKSGQVKTMRWNCMFEYGPEGQLIGLTSVGKDMTDKRIAMEALKDNKIRLQDLFDNAHDLIQNISVDNKFIFVNKAWKERLGYTDHDIESLTLNDIVHPYYKAKLIYQLRNLYKGENVNKMETVFLTKAGKPVHLIGSITCSWQDGRPVATRAILHDITDRIKAERLQKVYYSIANLAISSKDLNSLYSAIHRELSKIIETRNIFIALCDNDHRHLHFVYLIDQFVDKSTKSQMRRPFSIGLSEYIIESGKPLYMQKAELLELAKEQNLTLHGAIPEVILCSPLAIGDRIIGVITLQDYHDPNAYVHTDIEILHFISNQVALAIERKRNEEQINNQNARLNAIFESGSHHMWSLNRDFELTSFNKNFAAAFFNRSGQELELYTRLNDNNVANFHEHSFEFWQAKYTEAFKGHTQHFEVHLHNPESWREVYLNPIYLEDGTFEEISGIALDITDKKRSQLALAQSEVKFRSIFESFQDVYYRTTLNGIVELVSPSIQHLLGYREEEILNHASEQLYANVADRELVKQRVLEQKTIRDFEIDMVCKDGSVKTVLLDARLTYDQQGAPTGLEGVVRDVSELKRTQVALLKAKEEAENLLKVKTQFLANMSHELRTPMNGIIGMIDLLSQIITDHEQREYIDTLRKSSDALLAILNDILDLSKMQAGKLVLHENGMDLHDTLNKIHSLFANRAQQKDLHFIYNITPETPRYILTDETRFLQVLSNLTSNAIKFTNEGEVNISVDAQPLKKKGEYVLSVRVKDSGIGITEKDQKLLFTDFTQLDNSSTKTFGGTGLGLAISKQLTHLLGGSIGVESTPGQGSTFWFTIKVKEANSDEVEAQIQRLQLQNAEVESLDFAPYVLLVDDNQINQKVAFKLLERLGCNTDVASNGYEAIDRALNNGYHMIFMDIQMPEMDGITATSIIKEKLGSACPPVVAMTAYSMREDAEKFMSQGMDDYISKPVKSSDLHKVIMKWHEQNWKREGAVALELVDSKEASTDTEPVIDMEIVEQLREIGGNDFTRQLYSEFEQEAAELLDEAKKELDAQQYKSILSTLHQLKGTGFTLGINQVAELAKILEHDIKHDKFEDVPENFLKLQQQYDIYRKAYKEIII
ncbi:PAS domain S-box protein [Pontibacter sp. JH31]|uniref:histidine kinase n=1 Tax=Pontibacter aquaedesilientis TaxID=2766980 RepID=A0ABR7XFR3_9BACT|nr:PAS domain S-box protein [Pontibacter aquaedesilientis]MBD1397140.1 PAS domain S-box protein [Pontibacter aquaedesilientis]